ncbi:MAG: lipopolysaccharide kinase InaA family protein [Planctomycetota bacterium]
MVKLELVARSEEVRREASELALAAWSEGPRHGRFVELAGGRAYFKLSALAGKTRVRYAFKRRFLRAPLPRLAEFANLAWLRKNDFQAPEPLAAGALWERGLPRFQFLFTREVAGARTLASFLADETRLDLRAAVLGELARTVARMHSLRFLHHDLFPRNILVTDGIWFLDCWAGGLPPQARGPDYDLACLTRNTERTLSTAEIERILEVYASVRRTR